MNREEIRKILYKEGVKQMNYQTDKEILRELYEGGWFKYQNKLRPVFIIKGRSIGATTMLCNLYSNPPKGLELVIEERDGATCIKLVSKIKKVGNKND